MVENQSQVLHLDSQSVKTTETPGVRGYDTAKKVKGRKHHILVDTTGLLLMVVFHTADIQDQKSSSTALLAVEEQKLDKTLGKIKEERKSVIPKVLK